MRSSLPVLTSLRFFAAIAVVAFHIVVGRSGDVVPVQGFLANLAFGGYAAVTFFFILSGFILTYAHAGHSERDSLSIKSRTFWKLRLARLLPAYVMGLVLALPILAEFIRIMPPLERIVGPVLVVSLLQAWYPALSEIWNYPAWSLSVEVLFYASFPLLFSVASNWSRRSLFFAAYSLVLISALARAGMTDVLSTHFPLYHLPLFIFGMVLGRQFLFGPQLSASWHATIFAAGILLAIAIFGFRSLPSWTRSDAVLVVAFSLIIFGAARPAGAMTMLAVPAMVLLGEASYSIYILHVPLRLWWDGLGLGLPLWLNLALYILLLVTFSILSFRCIETPMRKRIARSSLTGFRVRACRPDLRPLSGRPQ